MKRIALLLFLIVTVLAASGWHCCAENPNGNGSYEAKGETAGSAEEAVEIIISQLQEENITGEWERALWLHDWLVNHANYDYTYTWYAPEGVLLHGTGVCESYTGAFRMLLNEIGIENVNVVSPEMEHTWNLVKLDGEWCHIDCTWDDPGTGGEECHTYFGMNDALISRDHQWDRNGYSASTSLANYYPTRCGELVYTNEDELDAILTSVFSAQEQSFTIQYIGTDASHSALAAFQDWYSSNNWKYGIQGYSSSYSDYACTIFGISYTEPWAQPANKLSQPVDAPGFSMNSPNGSFSLSSYQGNGLILIFGRTDCYNTRSLLQGLEGELNALHSNGIEVLVSVEGAETYKDIQPLKSDYPAFEYCYERGGLMSAYLDAVGYYDGDSSGWVTYPCVFVINGESKITYYSTGYVSNLAELVSEAYTASSHNPLPSPGENQYPSADTGNANISDLADGNVKSALEQACAQSRGVFFLTDYSLYDSDRRTMGKWEQDHELFESLGLSFVACIMNCTEEEQSAFPHVIFVDYDESDGYFWDLLGSVGWDYSNPAYYLCSYYLEHNGHISDYVNGGTLSVWDKVSVLVRNMTYDMVLPARLESVEPEAFRGAAFESADLSASNISSIGEMVFADCENLRFVRLPDSLTQIAPNAFLHAEQVIFVCSSGGEAARFAEENGIPVICP